MLSSIPKTLWVLGFFDPKIVWRDQPLNNPNKIRQLLSELQQAIVALQEATLRAAAKMWTVTTLDLTPKNTAFGRRKRCLVLSHCGSGAWSIRADLSVLPKAMELDQPAILIFYATNCQLRWAFVQPCLAQRNVSCRGWEIRTNDYTIDCDRSWATG